MSVRNTEILQCSLQTHKIKIMRTDVPLSFCSNASKCSFQFHRSILLPRTT